MEGREVRERLERALECLAQADRYLLENDLSERCIASRLAMCLQCVFEDYDVDVEYNRVAEITKRLHGLPDECTRRRERQFEASIAVPDVIVHRRGPNGPNLLVIEMKKTSNAVGMQCDRQRVEAFREQLGYRFGALVECRTTSGDDVGIDIAEWLSS